MHILLHNILHILQNIIDAYCAYCAYCTMHVVHIVHILGGKSHSQGFHCLLPLLLGLPTQGPAVHVPPPTTIADLSQKAQGKSAASRHLAKGSPEQEEGVPVWRTLEWHTKLVRDHGVRRRLKINTDPARLRSINKSKYAKYAKYAKYDLVFVGPCTLPALKHRHTRSTACQCLSL